MVGIVGLTLSGISIIAGLFTIIFGIPSAGVLPGICLDSRFSDSFVKYKGFFEDMVVFAGRIKSGPARERAEVEHFPYLRRDR